MQEPRISKGQEEEEEEEGRLALLTGASSTGLESSCRRGFSARSRVVAGPKPSATGTAAEGQCAAALGMLASAGGAAPGPGP